MTCFCEYCTERFQAKESTSILTVLDYHVNRNECINYEEIDVMEDGETKIDEFVLDETEIEEK